jgi:hypothetical protein
MFRTIIVTFAAALQDARADVPGGENRGVLRAQAAGGFIFRGGEFTGCCYTTMTLQDDEQP